MTDEEIIEKLRALVADTGMITDSAYTANTDDWPSNRIPFIETHLKYLKAHPMTNPEHYIANLRLMIRRR